MNDKRPETPFIKDLRDTLSYIILTAPFVGLSLGIAAGIVILIVTTAPRWAVWIVR